MIKNQKQYTAMSKQLKELSESINDIEEVLQKEDSAQLRLQLNTFEKGFVKLQKELDEYNELTSGSLDKLKFDSFKDDMNKAIMSFRIASGISQKKLAGEMFIQEQQIQRYEQSDYLSASFDRILQLLEALGVQMILEKDFRKKNQAFEGILRTASPDVLQLNEKVKSKGRILTIVEE